LPGPRVVPARLWSSGMPNTHGNLTRKWKKYATKHLECTAASLSPPGLHLEKELDDAIARKLGSIICAAIVCPGEFLQWPSSRLAPIGTSASRSPTTSSSLVLFTSTTDAHSSRLPRLPQAACRQPQATARRCEEKCPDEGVSLPRSLLLSSFLRKQPVEA
jgi:hypothetical protein